MNKSVRFLRAAICVLTLLSAPTFAQTPDRRQAGSPPQSQEQTPDADATGAVANEIALLRRSLQALNARLREIGERLLAPDSKQGSPPNDRQGRISHNMELLGRAEQRAELLRKQLLELIEKEALFRNRLVHIDEEMRPDSIDRHLSLVGTTRTGDLRDVRRRVLDNERKGVENLLNQTAQSRVRLEEDVKQADALVARFRQRLLPLIEKEIDSINPN